MTIQHRLLAGGTALVAGLCFLTSAAAAPPLPKETYKKVVDADIAQLQKHLDHIVANIDESKEINRYGPTTRGLAMMLAMHAEGTGDATLQADALKLADVLGKKDWKAAAVMAKKLTAKPGAAPLKSINLHTKSKLGLDEIMSPYRGGAFGGMNIEKDIRNVRDGKMAVDPAAIEILAARAGIISDYAIHFPSDKAMVNKSKTDEWVKLCKDSLDLSNKLVTEAAKGKKASEPEIVKLVKALDAKCVTCHKEFRDD